VNRGVEQIGSEGEQRVEQVRSEGGTECGLRGKQEGNGGGKEGEQREDTKNLKSIRQRC